MLEDFIKAYDVEYPCGIITLCEADSAWNKTDSTLYVGEINKIPRKYLHWIVTDFLQKYSGWVLWLSAPSKS